MNPIIKPHRVAKFKAFHLIWAASISMCLIACGTVGVEAPPDQKLDTLVQVISGQMFSEPDSQIPYPALKEQMTQSRKDFAQTYQQLTSQEGKNKLLDKARGYLHATLTEQMFPHWYGTAWDFNGISEVPGEGEIACGYFVSTTLKHAGFNLNRYRVAQSHALDIIETLTGASQTFRSLETLKKAIIDKGEGLYLLGLDNHIVFIDLQPEGLKVVHASYLEPVAVVAEDFEESMVLKYSRIFVLGEVTGSDKMLHSWLKEEPVWPVK